MVNKHNPVKPDSTAAESASSNSGSVAAVLTVNGGSSSIKFALFTRSDRPKRILHGQVERIGLPGTCLIASQASSANSKSDVAAGDFGQAAGHILSYLREHIGSAVLAGIGHRVVFGGVHLLAHQLITPAVLDELRRIESQDMAHLSREIALIEIFQRAFPSLPHVACFDTAFHHNLPRVAQILPIPRGYFNNGVRRYGYHGLSYTYLMERLMEIAGPVAAGGKIILAHLGSGASMAAVNKGKPIDTTMGFTPVGGLVMGTRPGDLDPGLLLYLMRCEQMSLDQMDAFVTQKCGLRGVSETGSDMRDLLARRDSDPRAADAFNLFCYQARKFLGALAAAMGGLDALVFSGGTGEHSPEVRAAICEGLEFLGLEIDPAANAGGKDVISASTSRVAVRVIATDEEITIAKAVAEVLQHY